MTVHFRILSLVLVILCVSLPLLPQRVKSGGGQEGPPKLLLYLPFYNETNTPGFEWAENTITESLHKSASQRYTYERIPEEE